jgi:Pyruvate/2-oxoacid:ferredoxin oxidoreductase gamma subunit
VKIATAVSAAAIVVGGLSGCLGQLPAAKDTSSTATAPSQEEGRPVASYFQAGDCIEDVSPAAKSVTLVECMKPHAAEVYAVFLLPNGTFPGDARIQEYNDKCSNQALAQYSPTVASDPSVSTVRRSPDRNSWDIGDRSVTCIVTFDPPRTGSVRGR